MLPIKDMNPLKITGRSLYGMRMHPTLHVEKMHEGVDYSCEVGTPILATEDGKVSISKMQNNGGGYGNYVVINHGKKTSLSAHMTRRAVLSGELVQKGDVIGYVGSTGESSGPHLHFGLCTNFGLRDWYDPLPYLEGMISMDKEEAKKIVKNKTGLSDETIEYLTDDYKYGKELIIKLAQAMI